jgi:hypothetical protein
MTYAQVLTHPSGHVTVQGVNRYEEAGEETFDEDWYAVPMMAGDTITLDGVYGEAVFGTADAATANTLSDLARRWGGADIERFRAEGRVIAGRPLEELRPENPPNPPPTT